MTKRIRPSISRATWQRTRLIAFAIAFGIGAVPTVAPAQAVDVGPSERGYVCRRDRGQALPLARLAMGTYLLAERPDTLSEAECAPTLVLAPDSEGIGFHRDAVDGPLVYSFSHEANSPKIDYAYLLGGDAAPRTSGWWTVGFLGGFAGAGSATLQYRLAQPLSEDGRAMIEVTMINYMIDVARTGRATPSFSTLTQRQVYDVRTLRPARRAPFQMPTSCQYRMAEPAPDPCAAQEAR